MPKIVLIFNYPEAPLPSYEFGDRVAVSEGCAPTNWLIGKIIGLTLDESYQPIWYRVRQVKCAFWINRRIPS